MALMTSGSSGDSSSQSSPLDSELSTEPENQDDYHLAQRSLPDDMWLSELERMSADNSRGTSHRLVLAMSSALQAPSKLLAYLRTSPGRLHLIIFILILAIAAAGGSMAYSSAQRQDKLNTLVHRTEPLSDAAQKLYGSLSVADSTASISFLQGGAGPQSESDRYAKAIQEASVSLTVASSGVDPSDRHVFELLTEINQRVPIYTGLIAEARANNRAGNPVGSAYLTEASTLMQDEILPAAAELYQITSRRVQDQERELTHPFWVPMSGLLAAVILLILAQLWVTALTNRRLNAGLMVATAMMLLCLLWVSSVSVLGSQIRDLRFTRAATPLYALTDARIEAQHARSEEALILVRRQGNYNSRDFYASVDTISHTLQRARNSSILADDRREIDDALEAASDWKAAHQHLVQLLDVGDYRQAVAVAVGSDKQGRYDSEQDFIALDRALEKLIERSRADLRSYLINGRISSEQISFGVFFLSIIAIIGIVMGVRARLREYQ